VKTDLALTIADAADYEVASKGEIEALHVLAAEVRRLREREVELRGFCARLRAEVGEHARRADEAEARETALYRRVRALVESDRDADGNLGILPRWSAVELERELEGPA
jgi:hypothetical protein